MKRDQIALSIAGWDASCGAGAAADLKTFAAWGVYGEAALTALTVQNTEGVSRLEAVTPQLLAETLAALAEDASFAVIKLGMLATAEVVGVVAEFLRSQPQVPVVIDPVLASSSGHSLLERDGLVTLKNVLLPLCSWATPNLSELAALTHRKVAVRAQVEEAAAKLARRFPDLNLVITGGHLPTPDDYLLPAGEARGQWIPGSLVESSAGHGTGCTFASSLAACIARWPAAKPEDWVRSAKRYVEGAIRHAPVVGKGRGPLEHFWRPVPRSLEEARS